MGTKQTKLSSQIKQEAGPRNLRVFSACQVEPESVNIYKPHRGVFFGNVRGGYI